VEDYDFPVAIRAKQGSPFRILTRTCNEAIDAIQELPDDVRARAHWQKAEKLLFAVIEDPTGGNISCANVALQGALHAEGWSA